MKHLFFQYEEILQQFIQP